MKHGGDLTQAIKQFGGKAGDWLDLSTGINPIAYPVHDIAWQQSLLPLPEEAAEEKLIAAARMAYGVPPHLSCVAAPGTQALIQRLPYAFRPQQVAIVSPTYASHEESWKAAGFTPLRVTRLEEVPDSCCLVVLVNPNNPTGQSYSPQDLLALAKMLEARGGTLIVDEAYADVMPHISILPHLNDEPVVVLRSFGKFYGLAGLRLGFAVGLKPIVNWLEQQFGSWAVSGPALAIGAKALRDTNWHRATMEHLWERTHALHELLTAQKIQIVGRTPLFTLISVGDANTLHEQLARHHIWTRVFDYSAHWIRLGLPKNDEDLARLAKALKE
ncbi:threonine-phosphate decarboxylase [Rhodobacteraceae bacterium RKSG542]|uniref:threonine-phosphate decarboxylase CobD n=1 Tax=Pseudovibrio flavus TaxID=2529854 RepID=UPI0012BC5907|nr:threonine-phosphate decarboxylase CobD [Pseudovibrio flavus]MTI17309.1 threonine-phosphate decarboxylase [Pseudovibrio flavus]